MVKKITNVFLVFMFLACLSATGQVTSEINIDDLDIPYQKFTLDNGLTLIVHEDDKAPIVAVNVWYHVGSKNEKEGKTGFAHLFEHLMFNGSENFNTDYFKAMESIGATDLNGTTNFDRTNYFQNVPKSALDIALWMESDRMGHFAGAISQERLDEQRGVVQNEKRQGENQPYGQWFNLMIKHFIPEGHPYSHSVIGEMEDLDAASLDDVKEWFKNYYGPANAVLVVAGDVEVNEIRDKVEKYFGDIPSGPPVTHPQLNIFKRSGTIRVKHQDRVPQTRIYIVRGASNFGSDAAFNLDIVSAALTQGKNSRLYKRLVYEDQIASSVNSFNWELEIAGLFVITADVKPGVDPMEVENVINEEVDRFLKEGPSDIELQRIKTQYLANFIRGIERIGGFGGKSDILAQNEVYTGDPSHYKVRLKAVQGATSEQVRDAANEWLSKGKFVLHINPFPKYGTVPSDVDRSKGLPDMGPTADVKFPTLQRTELSNGLKVILAERSSVPIVQMTLSVDAGYAADQFGTPGTAQLAMNMMDEGTENRTALEINEQLALLGATLNTGSNLDVSQVTLSALKSNLDPSLDLFSDVILNPAFPEKDLDRLRKQQLVQIQQEKASPIQMALRVFPKFMYGEDHAYGLPFTGSGYESSVSKLTREDLIKFYNNWFKPNNATLVVAGDISMDELKPKLEKLFRKWKAGDVPKKNLAEVDPGRSNKIYLMNRPGSQQSVIIAGHVAPPYGAINEIAREMANNILGGEFTSRVNMNLREDKGWAYGAGTVLIGAKGQRPFITYAPVQTDKTSESMVEIQKELNEYLGERKATKEEFEKTQKNSVLQLPGQWETLSSVRNSLNTLVRYGLSDDYYQDYAGNVRNLTLSDVQKVSDKFISPDNISWIVVGDKEKVYAEINELKMGEIVEIDPDGNQIKPDEVKVEIEKGN